jgi:Fur family ferric uptake transcriptional regulator
MSYTDQANSELENILKRSKLYITRPRTLVFNALLGNTSPLSVNELESRAKGEISRSSIYRTLQTLKKLNVVQHVTIAFEDKYELSDMFRRHHHHLTCEKCGRVIPIKLGDKMESAIQNFGRRHGFKIKSHEVELRGLCRYCC